MPEAAGHIDRTSENDRTLCKSSLLQRALFFFCFIIFLFSYFFLSS